MDHGGQSLKLVLDASMALAWIFERLDAEEAALANHLLDVFLEHEVWIPPLWYVEVANALLCFSCNRHEQLHIRLPQRCKRPCCVGKVLWVEVVHTPLCFPCH